MSRYAAVVLSAGSGRRMKSDIPKQYLDLNGYPVIYYSLKAFQDSSIAEIILVAGENDLDYCRTEIVEKYHFDKVTAIVAGGKERYDSVYEGLKAVQNADFVLIHDGARPMLTQELIERIQGILQQEKACVVGMPVKDTIKITNEYQYAQATPDRKKLWMIQTPQAFSYSLILEAYTTVIKEIEQGEEVPAITDDAMVVEYASEVRVKLVEGSYANIKITTPEDLLIASVLLQSKTL